MSLASVRPFFRSRLNALGFKEHIDAFDDENRAQNKLEKLYRLESGPASGSPSSQTVHIFEVPIALVITLKGVGDKNVDLSDRAWIVAEEVLADFLPIATRNGTAIKDIVPGDISISPYSVTDDNDLILNMAFTATVYCNFN